MHLFSKSEERKECEGKDDIASEKTARSDTYATYSFDVCVFCSLWIFSRTVCLCCHFASVQSAHLTLFNFFMFFFCQFRVSFMRLHFPIYAHSLGQLAYYTFHADLREGNLSYPRMSGLGGRLFLYKYVDVMGVT